MGKLIIDSKFDDLEIVHIFSKEEKDFNRAMAQRITKNEEILQFNKRIYAGKVYDFTSCILNEF